MIRSRDVKLTIALAALAMTAGEMKSAHAQDFFSTLFGGFARPPSVSVPALPFGSPMDEARPVEPVRPLISSRAAYCVRTCDGRYFPLPPTDGDNAAAVCNSFCPASTTKVVYGSDIDGAVTASGQPYSELPNAFRYRNELVAGCTCNGKDTVGLAKVKIEDDRTLRKGDVVAGPGGLVVASGRVDRRKAANFTPAPAAIRNKYQRLPVLAAE